MNKKKLTIGAFAAAVLLAVSMQRCYYDNAEDLYPTTVDTSGKATFSGDVLPLMTTRCATSSGCHASGSNYPVLENYDQIKTHLSSVENRAIKQKNMPPAGNPQPTQTQLDKLQQWIDDGAPNN